MGKSESVVLTNMCMVYDGEYILVQNRINKSWPGLTFPGGHIERGESFADSVIREVYEETGLTVKSPVLCGVKQFKPKDADRYIVFFYKTDQYEGELTSSDEGEVFWIKKDELRDYELASDFESMVEVFDSEQLSEFFYNENFEMELL
ncbi:8-oxo-dGTP diphosphatase [Alkalibacillus haloalkaliphilus]|uniref:8-oxo-dGTP diphosphatase n=1 Tax=Alkalibacillus haloalkaliphilus TaxID=94136 RepID=UPI0002F56A8B|nr:8-oxo-dGTP diphosphatase [Alkalibacillus haloalkaliphilus]